MTRSRLALALYPFVAAAVAINLFMVGLLGQSIGLPAFPPQTALLAALPLSLPATALAVRWVRHLLAEAGDP